MQRKLCFVFVVAAAFALLCISPTKQRASAAGTASVSAVASQGAEFNALKSDKLSVRLSGDGGASWTSSFVYKTTYNMSAQYPIYDASRASDTVSYTDFSSDFSGPVMVQVTLLTGNVSTAIVRPSDYGITGTISGNTYTFNMASPEKVSVEINESAAGYITNKLFIFGDPLETGVPNPSASDVYSFTPGGSVSSRIAFSAAWTNPSVTVAYFAKGLYYIGEDSFIPSGKTVYLAPGAYVYGSFTSYDPTYVNTYNNITISGRGVLDSFYGRASQVWLEGSGNTVQGVTLLNKYKGPELPADGSGVSVSAVWLCGPGTVENVKVVDWMDAGGIFGLYGTFTVDNCFIFTNDDCIDISFPDDSTITNNVTWNYYNGSALCFSWNSTRTGHKAYVNNLYVIHWDSKYDDQGNGQPLTGAKMAIFFASHDSPTDLMNFSINNVHVERMSPDSLKRFLSLCIYDNAYCSQNGQAYGGRSTFGNLGNIYFKNITIDQPTQNNVINGHDASAEVENVTFENLRIAGQLIVSAAAALMSINSYTNEISFIGSNLVTNGSFEQDIGYTSTPYGWTNSGAAGAAYSYGPGYGKYGDNSGTHYLSTAYSATTSQTVTGLQSGLYTAVAWTQTGGSPSSQFTVSDFGGATQSTSIPLTSTWTELVVNNIAVSSGKCTLAFVSNSPAGAFTRFDEVALYKQQTNPNVMNQLYSGTRCDINGQVGYEFMANANMTVDALGRPGTGMQWSHGIVIYRVSDGAYICGATITTSSQVDAFGYKYEMLPSNATLVAGTQYYIMSTESAGGDGWMDFGTITNYDASRISILGATWAGSCGVAPPAANLSAYANCSYGAPTFFTL